MIYRHFILNLERVMKEFFYCLQILKIRSNKPPYILQHKLKTSNGDGMFAFNFLTLEKEIKNSSFFRFILVFLALSFMFEDVHFAY